MSNPLAGWRVDPGSITTTGTDLRRPECVLAEPSGDLWAADVRGGVHHVRPDGTQELVLPRGGGGPFAPPDPDIDGNQGFSLPNGLCFDAAGDFVVADFGTNSVWHLTRTGAWSPVLDSVDGEPLGKANFPAHDRAGRLWFSVTASARAWRERGRATESDGYLVVVDEAGPRVVARDLGGANELRFDAEEEWLYVAETGADHLTRFRVGPGATLHDREVYGPERLGGGPDGFAFDAHGNLWTTLIGEDRLVAITPEGDVLVLWEDGDRRARAAAGPTGGLGPRPGDGLAPRMASVTFGGPDLQTVYVGSLGGTSLPTFRSPVPGAPLRHWR